MCFIFFFFFFFLAHGEFHLCLSHKKTTRRTQHNSANNKWKRVPLVGRAAGSPATWSMTVEGFAFSVLSRRQGGKVSFHLSFILLFLPTPPIPNVSVDSLSVVLYTHRHQLSGWEREEKRMKEKRMKERS